jgi:hypothetical protein
MILDVTPPAGEDVIRGIEGRCGSEVSFAGVRRVRAVYGTYDDEPLVVGCGSEAMGWVWDAVEFGVAAEDVIDDIIPVESG